MFIIIKDNYNINKYVLNKHFYYKGLEIYFKNDNYYINLKDNYYFSDDTKSTVLELKKYEIRLKDVYYPIELYVYELDLGIDDFKLYEKQNVLLANDEKANVVCNDFYLNDYYLYIADGYIQTNFEISVNGFAYNNEILSEGDIIEYLGIKIIYFNDYLYINNFNITNKLVEYNGSECIVKYPEISSVPNYYIPSTLVELNVEELEKYEPIKKNKLSDFIKSLIPNLIMSLSMTGLALISLYSSIENNQPEYTRISYILMPISMFMTGILVPLIFYIYDKSSYKKAYKANKDKYLNYLREYENRLDVDIKNYLDAYNSRYFNIDKAIERMFYAGSNSDDYLLISLGKKVISKELKYKLTDDKDIDECINKIVNKLNYIDDFPLFLDLKQNHIVSIVSKKGDKYYYFNKFLLELSYKHHYDDLKLAVYSKDNNLFDNVYNLPHLFINNTRLTLSEEKQLQSLDQMKLGIPLVILIYDQVNFNFTNKNIHVLYFSSDISDLYKNSDCVVEYLNNKAYLYLNGKVEFSYIQKQCNYIDYYACLGRLKTISNEDAYFSFSDIFSLDIENNYKNQNNTVDCSFAYAGKEILNFDLHESKQGPHGLIGGCTGSGKSELIVSLLLSLCIRYSPDYLNIVLIDYKGGGIKESLSYNNVALPHIVAAVSNLENNALERLIISLNNECLYRQELFKSLSSLSNTSIMNIDDYLCSNYKKYDYEKLAHLLIVVDEFAQLKKENPLEIKELVSLSRIGRSLGVHLILATQKPGGVIDEEIWSNAHFKIALKVFDEKDSMDIIKKKDAAYLDKAGSFLLQVDDSLLKGQSIYSKKDYYGNDPYKLSLLDNTLNIKKTYRYQNKDTVSECSVYCKKIIETCEELNIKGKKIEFLPAESKTRKQLSNNECLVIGESDDYINGKKELISYGLNDNLLVYSSRIGELASFLNTFNEFKRQVVLIANKRYRGAYISDSLLYDEEDDINYLLEYLLNHKDLNLTLVVEDINCLLSYEQGYLDKLCKLARRSSSLNLSLLFITTNSQISFKLINYFSNRILIVINDKSDLSAFYGMRSRYEGSSYYFTEEPISFIPLNLEKYLESKPLLDPLVKRIPQVIEPSVDELGYLLGYDLISKEKIYGFDVTVISLDESLLVRYHKAYNFKTVLYNYDLKIKDNSDLLWLGPGIFNQRLFVANNKEDLNYNEGIYICRGLKQTLRSIDDV